MVLLAVVQYEEGLCTQVSIGHDDIAVEKVFWSNKLTYCGKFY